MISRDVDNLSSSINRTKVREQRSHLLRSANTTSIINIQILALGSGWISENRDSQLNVDVSHISHNFVLSRVSSPLRISQKMHSLGNYFQCRWMHYGLVTIFQSVRFESFVNLFCQTQPFPKFPTYFSPSMQTRRERSVYDGFLWHVVICVGW